MTQSTRLRQVTTLTYYQRVEVKVDGPGGKWTVQLGESGRSKAPKVDGPGSKWTVQNTKVDGPQRMELDGTQSARVAQKG